MERTKQYKEYTISALKMGQIEALKVKDEEDDAAFGRRLFGAAVSKNGVSLGPDGWADLYADEYSAIQELVLSMHTASTDSGND